MTNQKTLMEVYTRCELFAMKTDPEMLEWSKAALATNIECISKYDFFIEYVFAVFVSGFKVDVIKKKWRQIGEATWGFNYVRTARRPEVVRERLLNVFGNKRKVNSVIEGAKVFCDMNWNKYKEEIKKDIDVLDKLPGIGPVLVYQLARNLGFNTIKPDVHIRRVADYFGLNPFEMCKTISEATRQPVHYVDTVFWVAGSKGKLSEWL